MKKTLFLFTLFFNFLFPTQNLLLGQGASLCEPVTLPYAEQFNVPKNQLPACSKVDTGSGNPWKVDTGNDHSGIPGNALRRELSNKTVGDTWFFTPGFSLETGRVYVLSYKYMDPKEKAKSSLRIKLGAEQAVNGMVQDLNSHEIYNQVSAATAIVEFSVETNGIYHIGFQAYSASQNEDSKLLLGDLHLSEKPSEWTATPSFIDFPEVTAGQASAAQAVTIARTNTSAIATLNLQAPADFELSTDAGNTWSSALEISYDAGSKSKTIEVRHVAGVSCGPVTGNIIAYVGAVKKLTVPISSRVISAAPVAMPATEISSTGFTANWQPVAGAANYQLDVSTSPAFETKEILQEGFEGGTQAPPGWTFANIASTYATAGNYGTSAPSLKLEKNAGVTSPLLTGVITSVQFWIKGEGAKDGSHLIIEGFNGIDWIMIDDIAALPTSGQIFTFNKISTPALPDDLKQIRWRYEKVTGNVAFDDVEIKYGNSEFESYPVSGESLYQVTGLQPLTAYYYRVAVAGPDCGGAVSNVISATTSRKSTVWNGTGWSAGVPDPETAALIAGPYDMKQSGLPGFNSYSLDVAAPLVIRSNENVTVQTVLTGSAQGSVTVEAGADFIQHEGGQNGYAGQFIVKQQALLKRLDYAYWGSPVAGQTLKTFSPGTLDNRFMTYNEATDTFSAVPGPAATTFATAKGYAIRASNHYPVWSDAATATYVLFEGIFSGAPNNGDITFPLVANGRGFNLVGNPYPSGLNFDLLAENGTIMPVAHFWTNVNLQPVEQQGSAYSGDNYASYVVNSGGAPAQNDSVANRPTGIIAPGQGFMVKAAKPAQSLVFSNAMRVAAGAGNPMIHKGARSAKDRFWLQLKTPSGNFNTMLVAYPPGATNDFDIDSDAEQLGTSSDAFYSLLPDGKKLKIQGRQFPLDPQDQVALGFSAYQPGDYTISLAEAEGVFANLQSVYLEDRHMGIVTDLTENEYTFDANAGITENRFVIRYKKDPDLSTALSGKNQFSWYIAGKLLYVFAETEMQDITIYDLSGRMVHHQKEKGVSAALDLSGIADGVYIVTVAGVQTQKTFKIRL